MVACAQGWERLAAWGGRLKTGQEEGQAGMILLVLSLFMFLILYILETIIAGNSIQFLGTLFKKINSIFFIKKSQNLVGQRCLFSHLHFK